MSVKFEIRMTTQTMYSFMLHHNYTHLPGIVGVLCGAVIFLMGIRQAEGGNTASGVLLSALAVFMIVYPPVMLWIRARRQVEASPVFKEPLCYELTDSGVKVTQYGSENESSWSEFQRAVSTNQALVLYMDKTRAVIFPRAQIGEQWAAVAEMISTHMPPDKVRIRQVN